MYPTMIDASHANTLSCLCHDGEAPTVSKTATASVVRHATPLQLSRCNYCMAYFGGDDIFSCSHCSLVLYCSVDCQKKDRKEHRVVCKKAFKHPLFNRLTVDRPQRALQDLAKVLEEASKRNTLIRLEEELLGHFSAITGPGSIQEGVAVTIWDFEDCGMCEHFALGLSSHTPVNYGGKPQVRSVAWPMKMGRKKRNPNDIKLVLQEKSIRARMRRIDAAKECAFCIRIKECGDVLFVIVPRYTEWRIGFRKLPAVITLPARTADICRRLSTDESFERCRQVMKKLYLKPQGVLFLRNIFSPRKWDFTRGELKALTPKVLLRTLLKQLLEEKIFEHGRHVSSFSKTVAFFHEYDDLADMHPFFTAEDFQAAADPKMIVGVFYTMLNSTSRSRVTGVFKFPAK